VFVYALPFEPVVWSRSILGLGLPSSANGNSIRNCEWPLPVQWNCLFVSNQGAFNVSRVSGRSALIWQMHPSCQKLKEWVKIKGGRRRKLNETRQNESSTERTKRLEEDKEHKRTSRQSETSPGRKKRLQEQKQHQKKFETDVKWWG